MLGGALMSFDIDQSLYVVYAQNSRDPKLWFGVVIHIDYCGS